MAEHPLKMDFEFILILRECRHPQSNITAQQVSGLSAQQSSLTRDRDTRENLAIA
ncbi:MAG: hypothetical protein IAF94_00410, partial [Pirellulaceae bacterium]|nr:hypothetical protein [Pirellulaceae bacterium]